MSLELLPAREGVTMQESGLMVRKRWLGSSLVALALASGVWGQQSGSAPDKSGTVEGRTVTVQELDRPAQKCRILKTWQMGDGTRCYQVQSLTTQEMMTIVETGPSSVQAGQSTVKAVSTKIYHWGPAGKPPQGCPVPPETVPVAMPAPRTTALLAPQVQPPAPRPAQAPKLQTPAPRPMQAAPVSRSMPATQSRREVQVAQTAVPPMPTPAVKTWPPAHNSQPTASHQKMPVAQTSQPMPVATPMGQPKVQTVSSTTSTPGKQPQTGVVSTREISDRVIESKVISTRIEAVPTPAAATTSRVVPPPQAVEPGKVPQDGRSLVVDTKVESRLVMPGTAPAPTPAQKVAPAGGQAATQGKPLPAHSTIQAQGQPMPKPEPKKPEAVPMPQPVPPPPSCPPAKPQFQKRPSLVGKIRERREKQCQECPCETVVPMPPAPAQQKPADKPMMQAPVQSRPLVNQPAKTTSTTRNETRPAVPSKVEPAQPTDWRQSWGKAESKPATAPRPVASSPTLPRARKEAVDPLTDPGHYTSKKLDDKTGQPAGTTVVPVEEIKERKTGPIRSLFQKKETPALPPLPQPPAMPVSSGTPKVSQPAITTTQEQKPVQMPQGQYPPGAASVLASGQTQYVPVPVPVVPPTRRAMPPSTPPSAPQLNQHVNRPMPGMQTMPTDEGNAFTAAVPSRPVPADMGQPTIAANAFSGGELGMPVQRPAMPMHAMAPQQLMYPMQMPLPQQAGVAQMNQLMQMLKGSDYPSQREWAADQLSAYDPKHYPHVVEALVETARMDPAATVRAGCCTALVKMQAATPSVKAVLEALRSDSDVRVRDAAGDALVVLGLDKSTPSIQRVSGK